MPSGCCSTAASSGLTIKKEWPQKSTKAQKKTQEKKCELNLCLLISFVPLCFFVAILSSALRQSNVPPAIASQPACVPQGRGRDRFGPHSAQLGRTRARTERRGGSREEQEALHPPVDERRGESDRHVRHEARSHNRRTVPANSVESNRASGVRILAQDGGDCAQARGDSQHDDAVGGPPRRHLPHAHRPQNER